METKLDYLDTALPFSIEAEQSVLGTILIDSSCITQVMEYINAECFYKEEHKEIYSSMVSMFTAGEPIDFVTVLEACKAESVFESYETAKVYLTQLVQLVPSTSNVDAYAKIVQDKYYIRSLILAARDIIQNASDGMTDAGTLLDSAEQKIYEIRQGRETRGLTPISSIIFETYDHLQKLTGEGKEAFLGAPSGYSDLDRVLTGLNKSDLILLAARPGMGKTSFALNVASNVAKGTGRTVAVFSLEMSKEQLVTRMLSSEAMISSQSLRTGNLKSDEWIRLAEAASVMSKAPIFIDDSSGITVSEMKAKLRRLKDLGLVVIDYLQLMSSGKRSENRVQEVSEMTRNLKIMAKDLNVPIITLSQLSRSTEARTDHRPMLSDLRESGSIEQDADIVLFLYRDAYYNRESEEQNLSECIVAKNRHGETNSIKLYFDGQYTRFLPVEMNRDDG